MAPGEKVNKNWGCVVIHRSLAWSSLLTKVLGKTATLEAWKMSLGRAADAFWAGESKLDL